MEEPGIDIVKAYLKDMSVYAQLTPEQERQLYQRYKCGDAAAKDELVVRNWRLVVAVANKYKNSGIEFLDLISEGNIGLIRGLEKYDQHRGTKVSTYCTYWIQQSISRAIMEKTRNIRLPVYVSENLHKIRNFQRKYEGAFGSPPSSQEIADALNLSLFTVEECLNYFEDTVSLDAPMASEDSDNSDSFYQAVADQTVVDPLQQTIFSNRRQVLNNILQTLLPRERDVIKMYFGIGRPAMTFEEIGKVMGFSKERACQIEKDALFKLKNPLRLSFLSDFCSGDN